MGTGKSQVVKCVPLKTDSRSVIWRKEGPFFFSSQTDLKKRSPVWPSTP